MSEDLLQQAARARQRLAAKRQAESAPTDRAARLTQAQTAMWMAERFGKAGARFNQIRAWRIRGALDLEALDRAIGRLLERHDAFRLRISVSDGQAMPDFSAAPRWAGMEAELCPRAETDPEAWVQRRLAALSQRRFDLAEGPLHAFHLLLCGPDDHVLVCLTHHIMADHSTFSILAEDLSRLYALEAGGSSNRPSLPTPASYRSFLSGGARRKMDPSPAQPVADPAWPTQGEGAAEPQGSMAHHAETVLDPGDSDFVHRAALACHSTVFGLSAALFQVLVSRICDQPEVAVSVSRTTRTDAAAEAVVGMCVENVQLSASLEEGPTVARLAGDVSRTLSRLPLGAAPVAPMGPSSASVIYYGDETAEPVFANCRVDRVEPDAKPLPVGLHLAIFRADGGLRFRLRGQKLLFTRATLESALAAYQAMLLQVACADDPAGIRPTILPLVPRQGDVVQFARHATAPAAYPDGADIGALFLQQVRRTPEAPALRTPRLRWSYRELAAQALAVCDWLRGQGLEPGTPIGLMADRGADHVRALLGAMLAGHVVVPLDPSLPGARLRDMIAIAGCPTVISTGVDGADLSSDAKIERLPPAIPTDAMRQALLPTPATGDPDRTAVIVFTSGSTGRPKGVAIPHRGIARLAAGLTPEPPGPGDRVPQLASPGFDATFIEIWGALLNGAEVVSPEGPLGDARAIGDLLKDYEVTKAFLTTGLFNLLVDTRPKVFRTLRWVATGGEATSREHTDRFFRNHPDTTLFNVYGPTENSALTTLHAIAPGETGPVPLGRPLPNNMAFVLDPTGHVLAHGFAGELWIGGPGLAREYIGQPDLTADRFRTFPAKRLGLPGPGAVRLYKTGDRVSRDSDGCLHFHGRIDSQIKFNGHRIEPAEVEDAVQKCGGVATAAVLPLWSDDKTRVTGIAAAIVPDATVDIPSLRAQLARTLPRSHLPTEFHVFDDLPLTPNGKVDRAALRAVLSDRRKVADTDAKTAALSQVDERLVDAWSSILGTPPAGPDTDFFLAGGNSLSAMQLLLAAEEAFDRRLDIDRFFAEATLNRLHAMAASSKTGPRRRFLVTLRDGDATKTPLIAVAGLRGACLWAREMVENLPRDGRPVFGLNLAEDDPLVANHDSLQSLADAMAEELLAEFGQRELHLVGYSFAGFLAFVLAGALQAKGGELGHTILIDPNSNLAPELPRFDHDAPFPVQARLNRLRWGHRLRLTPVRIDYIFCPETFPGPRNNGAEEYALLAEGGLNVHEISTSHLAVIHGMHARKLARMVDEILAGDTRPGRPIETRFSNEDLDRAYAARDLSLEGRTSEAARIYDDLAHRYGASSEWLHAARLSTHAKAGDRTIFLRDVMRGMLRDDYTALHWSIIGKYCQAAGYRRLARIAWRRAMRKSGKDVLGGFELVLSLLNTGEVSKANAIATEIERQAVTPIPALMARAAIAKSTGQIGQCHVLLLDALSRSTVNIGHVRAALNRILAPEDHQFALRVIDGALEYFKDDPAIQHTRSQWEARAQAAEEKADTGG